MSSLEKISSMKQSTILQNEVNYIKMLTIISDEKEDKANKEDLKPRRFVSKIVKQTVPWCLWVYRKVRDSADKETDPLRQMTRRLWLYNG